MADEIKTIVLQQGNYGDTEVDNAVLSALSELALQFGETITEGADTTDDLIAAKVALNILINKRNIEMAKINNTVYIPFDIMSPEIKTYFTQRDETSIILGSNEPPANNWYDPGT